MSFDISKISTKDTVELQLRHPATDELLFADEEKKQPICIVLYGASSKQYRTAMFALQNRRLKRGKAKPTAEAIMEEGLDLLVACSERAINMDYKGAALTGDVFREMYADPSLGWVKEQIDTAIADVAGFLAA